MGIFSRTKKVPAARIEEYFSMLTGYRPSFTTYEGGLYEMDLTRAAVDVISKHRAKLKAKVIGPAGKNLEQVLQYQPNPIQDGYNWLYRLSAITEVENNAFIIPLADDTGRITGFFPVRSYRSEIRRSASKLFLIYWIGDAMSDKKVIEYEMAGHLRKHYYKQEIFGDSNSALSSTLQLMDTQRQAIEQGVKSSATIRFLAKLANQYKASDITAERNRLVAEALGPENNSGVLVFDTKYSDIKQVDSRPYIVNPQQMQIIKDNVFEYFGVNEDILQSKFNEDTWNAFYEAVVEPWAIQLSLVLSNMVFTQREIAVGNGIVFEANRLQYASNATKISIVTQLFDRGLMTTNQGLEVFNMGGIGPEGDKRFIRKEYQDMAKPDEPTAEPETPTPAGGPVPTPAQSEEVSDDQQG
jgi:hypothetical protein